MKIVVTGSIDFDYLMSFPGKFTDVLLADQLEHVSLSFLVNSLKRQRGGTAPNIAYTLALLGGQPTVMATAGQDFSEYRLWLESQGVDTSAIIEIEGDYCASFFVNTDEVQNQIASFYPGAMAHASTLSFAHLAADTQLTIISPNQPEAMKAHVAECKALGIAYIYDPSQQTIRLSGEDLKEGLSGCFLLTVNEYEFSLIQEKTGLNSSEIAGLARGILVTRGADGADLQVGEQTYTIPTVPPSQVVDPTGAGDAFRAGLMRGIQLGLPWEIAGRMGALAATYVLEQLGTQNHHFTPAEFLTRYRQHFDDQQALDALIA
jgi:adenosine kinase